ncbi:hypothetical protein ACVXHB_14885 [Escherichia coli]
MGATFGIALTLAIIAGSELFTGHTMFLTFGVSGQHQPRQTWAIPAANLGWVTCRFRLRCHADSWGGGSVCR